MEKSEKASVSQFYTDSIYSNHLSEYRKHNVYIPKGYNRDNNYPIIFATDGSELIKKARIKPLLDSLIEKQIIKPIIYIASHSNNKVADSTSTTLGNGKKVYLNYRNFEYVDRKPKRIEDSLLVHRFKNHMEYFKNELIEKTEEQLNQKNDKNNRYFYGYSNGAGFGLSLLNNYPNTIGTYICYSSFGGDIQSNNWKKDIEYPKLYLQYGSEEFFGLKEDAEFLKLKYKELNLFAEIKEYQGGHDNKIWKEQFIKTITKLFKTE